MGRHARPTRGGNLLSMRSKKQTEWQKLLMESSLAYPRGKETKQKTQGEEKTERDQTLGYFGVVKPVTPKEDVPPRVAFNLETCTSKKLGYAKQGYIFNRRETAMHRRSV
ncbi:hypothetical protein AVEN_102045-1 [Araneus ventricosus]|uniref:Uncharacterized protein n=1 Tax=Araneus ventricosus TaxID=182803 RepID=A0A4Y2S4L3_ARAVE|nr:hypothetical protein AVEN_102045-1 [Araneus ventricosus]